MVGGGVGTGVSLTDSPLDRDLPGQRPPQTETETPWTETETPGQRQTLLDRDLHRERDPLVKRPPHKQNDTQV